MEHFSFKILLLAVAKEHFCCNLEGQYFIQNLTCYLEGTFFFLFKPDFLQILRLSQLDYFRLNQTCCNLNLSKSYVLNINLN